MERIERLQRRLDLYYKAEEAILTGQEYSIGTKKLRRADLAEVQNMIKTLEIEIKSLQAGGKNRALRGIPLDI